MWTQVFLTDYILRYEAVNSMSFLLTQKSTGLFSCGKMTDLATDVYMRLLNLINKPKTLTVPSVLVWYPIIKNWSNSPCWGCAWTLILRYSSRKNLKNVSSALKPVTNSDSSELVSVVHLITLSQYCLAYVAYFERNKPAIRTFWAALSVLWFFLPQSSALLTIQSL